MRTSHRRIATVCVLFSAVLTLTVPALGTGDRIEIMSANSDGVLANGRSFAADLSEDGRFAAFVSTASNLVEGDTNRAQDVFLRDSSTGAVERISIATDGSQMGGSSASLTPDGRFVAFESGGAAYVRDRQAGTTTLASPRGYHSSPSSVNISGDGRYVVFTTLDRLIDEDTNSCLPLPPPGIPKPDDYDYCDDVYMKDMVTGQLTRISVASNGAQGNNQSGAGFISADGRFVVFTSSASNLAPRDTNGGGDIFLRDLTTGSTRMLTRGLDGGPTNGDSYASGISADGRYVTFISWASNLAVGDQTPFSDVYVLDIQTSTFTVESMGIPSASAWLRFPASATISSDGGKVAFSMVTYLGGGIVIDAFVRDRTKQSTIEIAPRPIGDLKSVTIAVALAGDGHSLAFSSDRNSLVEGDANGVSDAFLVRLGPTCANGGREDGSLSSVIRTLEQEGTGAVSHEVNCEVLVPANL